MESSMNNRKNGLVSVLNAVGKQTQEIVHPDGTVLLLLPHGGRVLGLYTGNSEENLFWTHPALENVQSARGFYNSTEWHNSGGDRTWISPEVDVFFPEFPDTGVVRHQAPLDPGNYKLTGSGSRINLVNRFKLSLSRVRTQVRVEIAKSWEAAPNPLRYKWKESKLQAVEYAGYTQTTRLRILGPGNRAKADFGLWSILQLPHGGESFFPTHSRPVPKVFEGEVADRDLDVTDHLVRFKMGGSGLQKIGIQAVASTGRIAYLYKTRTKWVLVIRNAFVNPSGEYLDVSWASPEDICDVGYSCQACRVNNEIGKFSELEYHAPAIGGADVTTSLDISQLWAFRGSRSTLRSVARMLLSQDL